MSTASVSKRIWGGSIGFSQDERGGPMSLKNKTCDCCGHKFTDSGKLKEFMIKDHYCCEYCRDTRAEIEFGYNDEHARYIGACFNVLEENILREMKKRGKP